LRNLLISIFAVAWLLAGCRQEITVYAPCTCELGCNEEDDMSDFPCIAADNLARLATVSASTEETGYPVENVQDFRPSVRWKPTGSAPAYLQFDFGVEPIEEDWTDLTAWDEEDTNGTLSAASNELVYNSGANADDAPTVTQANVTVPEAFLLRVPFEIVSWATATDQGMDLLLSFDLGAQARIRVHPDGVTDKIAFDCKPSSTGDWVALADALIADASGSIEISRAAGGIITARIYTATGGWETLGTYTGGTNFEALTLTSLQIAGFVDTRTADAAECHFGEFLSGDDPGVDFFAVTGHNLASQNATVSLTASLDGSTWTDIVAAFDPADDRTFGQAVTSGVYRYYRLNITTFDAPPSIGVVYLGSVCQFPVRMTGDFDNHHRTFKRESNRSADGGHFLGSAITGKDRKIKLELSRMTLAWVAANIPDLFDLLEDYPAFVAWNLTLDPTGVYYMELDQDELGAPMGPVSHSTTLNFRGPKEPEFEEA